MLHDSESPSGENKRHCSYCGEGFATVHFEDEEFRYGSGNDAVVLKARVPVWSCDVCGEQYTDGAAEEIRHAAVCSHLGRLTPSQLRSLRDRNGLTQRDWAAALGIGEASVKRWESGSLIQSELSDRFMRLLMKPEIFESVLKMKSPKHRETEFKFQTELPKQAYERASLFELRLGREYESCTS